MGTPVFPGHVALTVLLLFRRLLCRHEGFATEARPRECLPKGFPDSVPGTCHFILRYRHPDVAADAPLADHVDTARRELGIGPEFGDDPAAEPERPTAEL